MYIDENTLKFYLEDNSNYDKLEKSKKLIVDRFEGVNEVFDIIKNNNQIDDNAIVKHIKDNNDNAKDVENLTTENMGLARVFVDNVRFNGIKNQNKFLSEKLNLTIGGEIKNIDNKNFITYLLSIMGGFDFIENPKVINEYRILSNSIYYDEYKGSTYSQGQSSWINSHFSDNTLFVEFFNFIKKCFEGELKDITKNNNISLMYPFREKAQMGRLTRKTFTDDISKKNITNKEHEKQQEILKFRFPYKFMWMWANTGKVIHPISLDAFRNFLKSDFMQEIFKDNDFKTLGYNWHDNKEYNFGEDLGEYPWIITDCHFDSFPKIWELVSKKVSKKLDCEDYTKLSKVISFLCIGETDMKNISDLLETHKQIILYGVPGTGKTYSAKKVIYDWINDKPKTDNDDIKEFVKEYRFKKEDEKPSKNIVWDIVQFHPNYSYQDFIGGIAPKVDNGGSLSYTLNHGIFKKFCNCASLKNNKNKKFIFIIDEINRANLSEVFGELLYALEYRDESVSVANFNKFCIPSNVYIIGTMNNVDKSLATFDLALRRRFGFYEVSVDYGAIHNAFEEDKQPNNIDSYIQRCIELNYFLSGDEDLSDYEEKKVKELKAIKLENTQDYYKIGHAYFMKIKSFIKDDEKNINRSHLEKLWIYHIEPLLMEYLGLSYDDNNIKERIGKIKEYFTKKLDEE